MKKILIILSLFWAVGMMAQAGFQVITNPPVESVRTMAEWEELDRVIVAFDSGSSSLFPFLAEVVRYAKNECEVILVCENETTIRNYLTGLEIDLEHITFLVTEVNSVWSRDYAPTSAYINDVDSLVFVDWIYNRHNRQADDTLSYKLASFLDIPVFTTTESPNALVNVGGNFMSDGMGTGFSTDLVLDDNDGSFLTDVNHEESEIDAIMEDYMGINRYIKFDVLNYDVIHHLDMHMKLLDEETILFSELPDDIADAGQIEANISYLLNNYKTPFGTNYEIVRIPVPPCDGDNYPPNCTLPYEYRNYANAFFVNKTVLVPTYDDVEWDTIALRIWRENMPGYNIIGINSTSIIKYAGAVHCVIKEVGVREPLRIVHQKIRSVKPDSVVVVRAIIEHKSGIQQATVYYKERMNAVFQSVEMVLADSNTEEWTAIIPSFEDTTTVDYYIEAISVSGEIMTRPMTAPNGFWTYVVQHAVGVDVINTFAKFDNIFPNPANAITCIPIYSKVAIDCDIVVCDAYGREVYFLFQGKLQAGDNKFFFDAAKFLPGVYWVQLKTANGRLVKRVIIY